MGKGMAQKSFIFLVILVLGAVFVASFYTGNTGYATRTIASAPAPRSTTSNIPGYSTTTLLLKGSSLNQYDSYTLQFTNRQGVLYAFPYLTYRQNRFSYGEGGQRDLIFSEASSPTAYNIGLNDTFILSDQTTPLDDTAISHVVQYINFDPFNRVLDFYDVSRGQVSFTYQCTKPTTCFPGMANLIFSGNTYTAYVDATGTLAVDQNADNAFNGRKINLVAEEAGKRLIIDLGIQQFSGNGLSIVAPSSPLTFFHSSSSIINRLTLQRATVGGSPVILLQQATTPN